MIKLLINKVFGKAIVYIKYSNRWCIFLRWYEFCPLTNQKKKNNIVAILILKIQDTQCTWSMSETEDISWQRIIDHSSDATRIPNQIFKNRPKTNSTSWINLVYLKMFKIHIRMYPKRCVIYLQWTAMYSSALQCKASTTII